MVHIYDMGILDDVYQTSVCLLYTALSIDILHVTVYSIIACIWAHCDKTYIILYCVFINVSFDHMGIFLMYVCLFLLYIYD